MRIAHVASEALPYSKTGGLADVAAALPQAQAGLGREVFLMTPWYGPLSTLPDQVRDSGTIRVDFPHHGTMARVFTGEYQGVRLLFIHRPEYFDRAHLYGPPGEDYFDNPERYIFFCRAVWMALQEIQPDIVHCHDWQTALVPALLRHWPVAHGGRKAATVTTIHNLAFQGICPASMFAATGLPHGAWSMHEGEFFGSFNLLKAGLATSDAFTTVSPTYAREILTPQFGCGLEGFLLTHQLKLDGIANGIDTSTWNPARDSHLPATYSAAKPAGKKTVKKRLLEESGLPVSSQDKPLAGFVGRLTRQKGADMIIDALPQLLQSGLHLVLLGRGDSDLEEGFLRLASQHPKQVSVTLAYDEGLAHRIIAGSDIFLMPSRFEPCGLTQLYAMTYGTVPVTTRTGGLADTVTPHPARDFLGFHLVQPTARGLALAVGSALAVMKDAQDWNRLVKRAMARDFSWTSPANLYLDLYERLLRQ